MKIGMLVIVLGENHRSIDELAQTKKKTFFRDPLVLHRHRCIVHCGCECSTISYLYFPFQDGYGQTFEEKVVKERKDKAGVTIPTHFINKKIKYIWDPTAQNFARLR